jgi:hypothetical protein
MHVEEKTDAGYLMLNFGGKDSNKMFPWPVERVPSASLFPA